MRITKKQKILEWLKSGKPITAIMAVQMFNCINLSNIISKLRKEGYIIDTETVLTSNGDKFGRYVLNMKENEERNSNR